MADIGPGQTSGRGLDQPHHMPHALSSKPKLKAVQTLVPRLFLVGGEVFFFFVVKEGSCRIY